MKKDIIAMSQKERQRYHLLKMVIGGKIALKETDNLMGVSYRHAKRLKKKLISEGAKGLSMAIEEDHLPRPSAVSLLEGGSLDFHRQKEECCIAVYNESFTQKIHL